jgi:hypothetical protein
MSAPDHTRGRLLAPRSLPRRISCKPPWSSQYDVKLPERWSRRSWHRERRASYFGRSQIRSTTRCGSALDGRPNNLALTRGAAQQKRLGDRSGGGTARDLRAHRARSRSDRAAAAHAHAREARRPPHRVQRSVVRRSGMGSVAEAQRCSQCGEARCVTQEAAHGVQSRPVCSMKTCSSSFPYG